MQRNNCSFPISIQYYIVVKHSHEINVKLKLFIIQNEATIRKGHGVENGK